MYAYKPCQKKVNKFKYCQKDRKDRGIDYLYMVIRFSITDNFPHFPKLLMCCVVINRYHIEAKFVILTINLCPVLYVMNTISPSLTIAKLFSLLSLEKVSIPVYSIKMAIGF